MSKATERESILEHVRGLLAEKESVSVLDHVKALMAEMDLRYQQRFEGQERAMEAAFAAAKEAVGAALAAAKEAVTKAEVASEKRLDGLNELRGMVQDILAVQMPRAEAEQRLAQLVEKIDELKGAQRESTGQDKGSGESRSERRLDIGQALQVVTTVISVIAAAIAAIALLR